MEVHVKKVLFMGFMGILFTMEAFAAIPVTIIVSCYRGPWEEVIWDRPNPIFIDTLMEAGYSITTATSVANRICRDPALVGEPEASRVEMLRLLRTVPRDGLK